MPRPSDVFKEIKIPGFEQQVTTDWEIAIRLTMKSNHAEENINYLTDYYELKNLPKSTEKWHEKFNVMMQKYFSPDAPEPLNIKSSDRYALMNSSATTEDKMKVFEKIYQSTCELVSQNIVNQGVHSSHKEVESAEKKALEMLNNDSLSNKSEKLDEIMNDLKLEGNERKQFLENVSETFYQQLEKKPPKNTSVLPYSNQATQIKTMEKNLNTIAHNYSKTDKSKYSETDYKREILMATDIKQKMKNSLADFLTKMNSRLKDTVIYQRNKYTSANRDKSLRPEKYNAIINLKKAIEEAEKTKDDSINGYLSKIENIDKLRVKVQDTANRSQHSTLINKFRSKLGAKDSGSKVAEDMKKAATFKR